MNRGFFHITIRKAVRKLSLFVVGIFVTFAQYATPVAADSPPIGAGMVNFEPIIPPVAVPAGLTYRTETGENRLLNSHGGEVVLVNFWATWCAPCLVEMPDLNTLAGYFADTGFYLLTLNQDRAGRRAVDRLFDEKAYDHLPRALDPKSSVGRALGVRGLPTSFLIDRNGRIVGRVEGTAEWAGEDAKNLIRYYLQAGERKRKQAMPGQAGPILRTGR